MPPICYSLLTLPCPYIIHDGATNLVFGLQITPPSRRLQTSRYNESS